jgi:signal transduction histidine kinase
MKLADFIDRDVESILSRWEAFARGVPAGASMDAETLRNHARQILDAIRKDIAQEQTPAEQSAKSEGLAQPLDARETAAQTHALLRARGGFDINQMASEYRALRASVIRLWADACAPEPVDLEDMIRFNEAIDQALCESIAFFSGEVDRARDLLLGALGHDLRSPLNSIRLTADHLQQLNAGKEVTAAATRLIKSGTRMKALLDDLTDFNRTRLGLGISVRRDEVDLARTFEDQVQQIAAAFPGRQIDLRLEGDLCGRWDPGRLDQVLSNLVLNALRYGDPEGPVRVEVAGTANEVTFSVVNRGPMISPSMLAQMFEPLKRGTGRSEDDGNLGLGLYICREITRAHGGAINATSSDSGTTFIVRLPRGASATRPINR